MPLALFFFLALFPLPLSAQVVISEIAWMGTAQSATDEWIELFNGGAENAALGGWVLTAADRIPEIHLDGSIAPGGYFLLERTNDESVPGVTADLIYTGALGNSGETLRLKDAAGTVVDEVVGGEQWQSIGGDNASKHTAQRIGSAWSTATGTPRAENRNAFSSSPPPASPADSAEGTAPSNPVPHEGGGAGTNSPAEPLERRMSVRASIPAHAVAGASPLFSAEAFDARGEPVPDARYLWSFGDGAFGEGQQVSHIYHFPGRYVVVVDAASGERSVSERGDIAVAKAAVRISRVVQGTGGMIEVENSAEYALNLSGWHLVSGSARFTFPPNTLIAAKRAAAFAAVTTHLDAVPEETALLYPNGAVAARFARETPEPAPLPAVSRAGAPEPRVEPAPATLPPRGEPSVEPSPLPRERAEIARPHDAQVGAMRGADEASSPAPDRSPGPAATSSLMLAAARETAGEGERTRFWFFLALLVAVLGVAGIAARAFARSPERGAAECRRREAEEYDLVE